MVGEGGKRCVCNGRDGGWDEGICEVILWDGDELRNEDSVSGRGGILGIFWRR